MIPAAPYIAQQHRRVTVVEPLRFYPVRTFASGEQYVSRRAKTLPFHHGVPTCKPLL